MNSKKQLSFFIQSLIPKPAYIALVFFVFSTSGRAQNSFSDNLSITAKYHHGYIVPEYQNFIYLVNENVNAFGFNILKKTTGSNDWEQLYNFPEYGFSFFYSSLGNDSVFGHEYALYPYFNLDIVSGNRVSLYNQIGVGLSYITEKFDLKENYKNVVVGSHFNIHFNTKFGLKFQLTEKFSFHTGLSFDHFSNGNTHEPNIGINSLTLYSGLDFLVGKKVEMNKHQLVPYNRQHEWKVFYSVGGKHARALDSHFYFTSSVSAEFNRSLSRVFYVGAGADVFYDSSTETELKADKTTTFNKKDDFRTGIHISQKVVYNRLSLELQEGVYIWLVDKVEHNVMYNRGIIGYTLSDRFSLRIAMKSHLHILDYPEIGIGVKL